MIVNHKEFQIEINDRLELDSLFMPLGHISPKTFDYVCSIKFEDIQSLIFFLGKDSEVVEITTVVDKCSYTSYVDYSTLNVIEILQKDCDVFIEPDEEIEIYLSVSNYEHYIEMSFDCVSKSSNPRAISFGFMIEGGRI